MVGVRDGRNEDALSEIVGFVLILALVVVASTLYLLYVVPAEGREDEITHMNQVQDRFVSYKTSVDGLWMRSLAEFSATGTKGVSLSTSFDLGTGGGNTQSSGIFLSFMKPIGTAAKMRTQLDSSTDPGRPTTERIGLTVDGNEQLAYMDGEGVVRDTRPMGSLGYYTDNYYWIQQNYFYKLGGVFLEQPGEGVSVKVAPPIAIYGVRSGTGEDAPIVPKISISLINITDPSSTVGGTGPLRVETRLRESLSEPFHNDKVENVTLLIKCPDDPNHIWPDAWRQVFVDAAMQSDLDRQNLTVEALKNGQNAWIHIPAPDYVNNTVVLKIGHYGPDPGSKDVYFDLNEATLQVTFEYDEP
ncbi:MAG: hypothetical protein ABFC38_08995 [Methanospirillum sp.]